MSALVGQKGSGGGSDPGAPVLLLVPVVVMPLLALPEVSGEALDAFTAQAAEMFGLNAGKVGQEPDLEKSDLPDLRVHMRVSEAVTPKQQVRVVKRLGCFAEAASCPAYEDGGIRLNLAGPSRVVDAVGNLQTVGILPTKLEICAK